MARRRRRFGALNEKLRAVGGTPSGTGEISEYFKFVTGQKKIKIENKIDGAARKLYNVAVIPFGASATGTTADERTICPMSAYSINGLINRTGVSFTDLGIYTDPSGANVNPNFYPALIRASFSRSGAVNDPDKISQITGREYSYTPTRNFSFPFGRATTVEDAETGTAETSISDVDELDAARSYLRWIKQGFKDGTTGDVKPALSVSYDPEVYRPATSRPDAPATTIADVTVG